VNTSLRGPFRRWLATGSAPDRLAEQDLDLGVDAAEVGGGQPPNFLVQLRAQPEQERLTLRHR